MASIQAHLGALMVRLTMRRAFMRDPSIANGRRIMEGMRIGAGPGVRYDPIILGGVPGEMVRPAGSDPATTLLYLHGGGYIACNPRTHRPITAAFARRGFTVLVPEYRLAPEHPFPAAYDDAMAVYRAILDGGTDPAHLTVAGESAGGGLLLALLAGARAAGLPMPAAAVAFSPWTDMAGTGASRAENTKRDAMFDGPSLIRTAAAYLSGADPRDPRASPLYAGLRGLPPLLLHASDREVLRDDSVLFAAAARAAGVDVTLKLWPVVTHAWQFTNATVPEARASMDEAAAFLTAHAAVTAPASAHAPA